MIKKLIQVFVILLLIAVVIYVLVLRKMHGRKSSSPVEQKFTVESGEGVNQISQRLETQGLISDNVFFDLYIWKVSKENKIVAGTYNLKPNMTIPEIVDIITAGKHAESKDLKIKIIEGWSNKKIAEYLSEQGIVSKEDFKEEVENISKYQRKYEFLEGLDSDETLEGYLFPDTYFIYPDSSAQMIVVKFLNNFNKKVTDTMRQDIKKKGRTLKEVIIMASILEREAPDNKDQKIISGIFWNRYQDKHPLQSCATINYILGNNKKQLSYEDTRIDSPYNTYLNKGLPPGPISNPGINSIMAAIYPQESDYYYFLNDPKTGEIIYSRTIDEHNQKKQQYGL
ncbi:MAG: endolytic transglycosylase MltG [Candidatus Moranbacteria bacterium]|nr:endolytic transglycosylase MltG [Candidatus Moranbacteria bacterium]